LRQQERAEQGAGEGGQRFNARGGKEDFASQFGRERTRSSPGSYRRENTRSPVAGYGRETKSSAAEHRRNRSEPPSVEGQSEERSGSDSAPRDRRGSDAGQAGDVETRGRFNARSPRREDWKAEAKEWQDEAKNFWKDDEGSGMKPSDGVEHTAESSGDRGAWKSLGRTHERRQRDSPRDTASSSAPLSLPYTTAASQFLYGRSTVKAALTVGKRKVYKLYVSDVDADTGYESRQIRELAERKEIPVEFMDQEGVRLMDKMSSSRPHNGFVLEASPAPQLPVTGLGEVTPLDADKPGFKLDIGQQSLEEAEVNGTSDFVPTAHPRFPLVVVLDQVLDPGNLGGVLRSASFFGADAVAMSKRNSAQLTSVAIKASTGASEQLTLLSIDSMYDFLKASRTNGWRVYAAVPHDSMADDSTKKKLEKVRQKLDVFDLHADRPLARQPCILLLGSEGSGLTRMLKGLADFQVGIPNQSGSNLVDSLNVSVAAGVLCSAFLMEPSKKAAGAKDGPKQDMLF
jgi:21S rRNA (GM2251-2'-O)-methyltransferase